MGVESPEYVLKQCCRIGIFEKKVSQGKKDVLVKISERDISALNRSWGNFELIEDMQPPGSPGSLQELARCKL